MCKCFIWAVVIQIFVPLLLLIAIDLPHIGIVFYYLTYISMSYYIIPVTIGMAAGSGIYAGDMGHGIDWRLLFSTAFIQVLLVSYLVCRFRLADKLRSWFKKRREDRIGE